MWRYTPFFETNLIAGSCIAFDLLQHQGEKYDEDSKLGADQMNGQPEPVPAPELEPVSGLTFYHIQQICSRRLWKYTSKILKK